MKDDLGIALAAGSIAVVAATGLPVAVVPWLAAAGLLAVVLLAGATTSVHPVVVVVAIAVLVGARSDASLASLRAPVDGQVSGVAELVGDPEPRRFGVQVTLDLHGRRYLAEVPLDRAAAVRGSLTGERVRVTGRTASLDGAPPGWVISRHLAARLSVTSIAVEPGCAPWLRLANGVHRTITAGATSLGDERSSLYTGLVLGDDRDQSELTRFRFQASGLTHLLAVSGQNVAFVLAVCAPVLRRLDPRARMFVAGAVLVLFVLVTRAEPSVIRASVMASVALLAVTTGRTTSGLRVLALTVMAVLVVDPLLVHSMGFQLSVCATAGLLVLSRPIADRLRGPEWLRLPLAVTIAAQLATAPLLLALAGALPSVAVLANLLAGPAAGLTMMLGTTVGLLAGLVREPLSRIVQTPTGLVVGWIDTVATWSSQAPASSVGPVGVAVLVGAGALVAVTGGAGRSMLARRTGAGAAALAVLVVLWPGGPREGRVELDGSSTLSVGRCGVVVEVREVDGPDELLEQLWLADVRRIDVLLVGDGQRTRAAAQVLAEQYGAVPEPLATPGHGSDGADGATRCG